MKKYDALQDISKITTIPEFTLKKLFTKFAQDISHDALEANLDGEDTVSVDIGIGSLNIQIGNNEVLYKFIPSKSFEQMLINTINSKQSPLVKDIEKSLSKRIVQLYKELL